MPLDLTEDLVPLCRHLQARLRVSDREVHVYRLYGEALREQTSALCGLVERLMESGSFDRVQHEQLVAALTGVRRRLEVHPFNGHAIAPVADRTPATLAGAPCVAEQVWP